MQQNETRLRKLTTSTSTTICSGKGVDFKFGSRVEESRCSLLCLAPRVRKLLAKSAPQVPAAPRSSGYIYRERAAGTSKEGSPR